jgi:hypothetical protein
MKPEQIALLDKTLSRLEKKLEELSVPLIAMDHDRIVQASAEFQQALVESAGVFREFKLTARVPVELVNRMRAAFAKVIALREALNRMTSSIDRALEVLIPKNVASVYGRHLAMPAAQSGRFASYNA